MKISELDDYKSNNEHLEHVISAPGIIGGQTVSGGKLPETFKDNLREMKKKHPTSTGLDHLI